MGNFSGSEDADSTQASPKIENEMLIRIGNPDRHDGETAIRQMFSIFRLGGGGWSTGEITEGAGYARIIRCGDGTPALERTWWGYGTECIVRQVRLEKIGSELRCLIPAVFADVSLYRDGLAGHERDVRIKKADGGMFLIGAIWQRRTAKGEPGFAVVTINADVEQKAGVQIPLILSPEEGIRYLMQPPMHAFVPSGGMQLKITQIS